MTARYPLVLNGTSIEELQSGDSIASLTIGTDVQAYDSNLTSFVNTFTLPTSDGSTDQVLKTDGAGTLSFTTVSAGVSTGKAIAMAIVFG